MAWYDTGTVAVTNGSTTVTGTGTNFITGAQVGEAFYGPDSKLYEIQSITSATVIILADAYLGSTQSGQSYQIVPTQSLVADLAVSVTDLISDFADVRDYAGNGKFNDGSVGTPGITFTQDQDNGLYRIGANNWALAAGGQKIVDVSTSGIALPDNGKATFGAGDDLQIYHNGGSSLIEDAGSGGLYIRASDTLRLQAYGTNADMLRADSEGAVSLFYDKATYSAAKLATTATGIDVTGNVESDSVTIGVGAVAGTEKLRVNGTILTLGGTNSVPAIGIGDVNTGIYAPTAGTLGWTVNGTQKLLLNSTGIDVTGTATMDGLTVDNGITTTTAGVALDIVEGSASADAILGIVAQGSTRTQIRSTNSLGASGDLRVLTADTGVTKERLNIASNGDISFYEDTGTTPKFFWDASAESLGIGVSNVNARLEVAAFATTSSDIAHFSNSNGSYKAVIRLDAQGDGEFLLRDASNSDDVVITAGGDSYFNGGSVGIGTDSPVTELDVAGIVPTLTIKDTQNKSWTSSDTTLGELAFRTSDSSGIGAHNVAFVRAVNELASGSTPSGALSFGISASNANASEAVRIDSGGNVLVGKTAGGSIATVTGCELLPLGLARMSRNNGPSGQFNLNGDDGNIVIFSKSGTSVGSIGTTAGNLWVAGATNGIRLAGGTFNATNASGTVATDTVSLGYSNGRWTDLYLSGGVYLGGTGAANKLDDYEEGTFTATINGSTEPATLKTVTSYYTKVGEKVHFQIAFENIDTTGYAGDLTLTGLPFTSRTLRAVVNVVHYNTTTWSTSQVPIAIIGAGATSVQFLNQLSGGTWTVNEHNAGTGRYLWITGTYITAA